MSPRDIDAEIKSSIAQLEALIYQRVEFERDIDQLTGLPNGRALQSQVTQALNSGETFWIAFAEVDRFKSINTKFGYERADVLLKAIAKVLDDAAYGFAGMIKAFRPHGDEFYLFGTVRDRRALGSVARGLEDARQKIADHVEMVGSESMRATVSIGWLTGEDAASKTYHGIIEMLETAVAEAKRTRNCVHRYDPQLNAGRFVTLRSDCATCSAKFSVDITAEKNRAGNSLHCPNCGASCLREDVASVDPIEVPMLSTDTAE